VDHYSFPLDLKIIVQTLLKVLKHQNVKVDQDMHEIDDIGIYDDSIGI